ncbi:MAG: glycosyltransferase family 2 protein [Desulfohalobiaceae bacterium]
MTVAAQSPAPELSIVVPVYNEAQNLQPMYQELRSRLETLDLDFEVIFINDASQDQSQKVLEGMQQTDSRIRLARHSFNSGESAAQATGFFLARGSLVMTMDADQQNDPGDIPAFLKALQDGVDCVCGVRSKRNDTLVKQFSSWAANRFRNFLTKDQVSDAGCTFRLLRKSALQEMLVFNGMHRFIPTILRLQGFKVVEIPIQDRPRAGGVSKYGVGNRMFRGILDCLAMRWYSKRAVLARRSQQQAEPARQQD